MSIEVKNLTKAFGAVTALNNVSVAFEPGKICGLLGRNGAGKSTLLNLVTGKLFPTNGEILLDGEPVWENDNALSKIYFMSEELLYPESMTVKDVIKWTGEFYPHTDSEYAFALADRFALNVKKKLKTLSTGYASIFKIIVALACNAPVLLLDEPVLGLDANFRDLFYRELIASYSKQPKTIVISTHLIEEAAAVIENVVIIKDGEIIRVDTVANLLSSGYTVTGPAQAVDGFTRGLNVLGCDTLGGIKSAYVMDSQAPTGQDGVEITPMRLQSLFIHLTNGGGNHHEA